MHEIRIVAKRISDAEAMLASLPKADIISIYVPPRSGWFFRRDVDVVHSVDPMHEALCSPANDRIVWITCPGFEADDKVFDVRATKGIVSLPGLFVVDGLVKVFDPPPIGMMVSLGTPSEAMVHGFSIERDNAPIRCALQTEHLTFTGRRGVEIDEHTERDDKINAPQQAKWSAPKETQWSKRIEIVLVHCVDDTPSGFFTSIIAVPKTQLECELLVRSVSCHWLCMMWRNDIQYDWEMVVQNAAARFDREMLLYPGMAFVNPSRIRMLPPLVPNLKEWVDEASKMAYLTAFDADCTPLRTENTPRKSERGSVRACVLSMCGVSSAEDRYGLGGEHQVVHWLRDGFLRDSRIELCDIYDTINSCMAPDNYYDLVLSNSCWTPPPRPTRGGMSIFWHFNTNCHQGSPFTVQQMGYDTAWTNSLCSIDEFQKLNMSARLKHLNASTELHEPYPWKSELFQHDVVYVGGYQVEYKGLELIRKYIKTCIGQGFDFAIYGNRKWQYEVQLQALKTDSYFKSEHLDDSYDPVWKGVLHPQDFRILAKNAKIWVNFNSEDQRPLGMCNDRPIWSMYAGAFLITDESKEQHELYGDTCDYSSGESDLLKKIAYWLEHDDKRADCALQASQNMMSLGLHTDETARIALAELERDEVYLESAR